MSEAPDDLEHLSIVPDSQKKKNWTKRARQDYLDLRILDLKQPMFIRIKLWVGGVRVGGSSAGWVGLRLWTPPPPFF